MSLTDPLSPWPAAARTSLTAHEYRLLAAHLLGAAAGTPPEAVSALAIATGLDAGHVRRALRRLRTRGIAWPPRPLGASTGRPVEANAERKISLSVLGPSGPACGGPPPPDQAEDRPAIIARLAALDARFQAAAAGIATAVLDAVLEAAEAGDLDVRRIRSVRALFRARQREATAPAKPFGEREAARARARAARVTREDQHTDPPADSAAARAALARIRAAIGSPASPRRREEVV